MSNAIALLQELLRSPEPDYIYFRAQLLQEKRNASGLEAIRTTMILRLVLALTAFAENQAGPADILILLRQIIRAYSHRLELHSSLWERLKHDAHRFGLENTDSFESSVYEIKANLWKPNWLSNADNIDELELRRADATAVGDGLIAALSNGIFTTYQSEAQKAAVQECLFAEPGSTLLITLPTGAGKSLCIQMPAWQESQGGQVKGGTTLVIVPTVSLALDQEERSRELFSQSFGQEFTPSSLTGATSETIRLAIYKGIEQGTLPILFTSPESLMTTSLYQICIEAAQRGTINRLVIDEAHLIETWGAGFRTEFQFLAAYRKKLLESSKGQLRTLLLSATVSTRCEKLLKRLFGSSNSFHSIRADRLRPEIAYWFDRTVSLSQRETHVIEALRHLPRPAIIYVTTPDDTKQWVRTLKEQGFQRVAAFSGDTRSDERLRLIKAWNENEYDLMIATSAFGVGVDKSDVRTVIHACLPENIDRFYQEVGRAGRDGYSANSLLYLAPGDLDQAKSMSRTARITTQKAISRWEGMQYTRRSIPDHGDLILVDTNATPSANLEMYKGPSNREWNEHTLLLMQRARLIEITEMREDLSQEQEENISQENLSEESATWLQIRLLDPHITTYPRNAAFIECFEKKRQEETDAIHQALEDMRKVVSEYTGGQAKHCLARAFSHVYSRSSLSCGGCPYCRKVKRKPYVGELDFERENADHTQSIQPAPPMIREIFGLRQRINIKLNEPCELPDIQELQSVFIQLIRIGFQQLIIPDALTTDVNWMQSFIRKLADHTEKPHVILPTSRFNSVDDQPVYPVPTIIVYPLRNEEADQFHRALRYHQTTSLQQMLTLAIARQNLMLQSEHGAFFDRINGLTYNLAHLQSRLQDPDELIF